LNRQEFTDLIKIAFSRWQKQDSSFRAGALTFFTIMPLPSLALIAVAILAEIYGKQQALQQLVNQVSAFAGPAVAGLLQQLLLNAQSPLTSFFASLISVAFAISGALGAFSVLQKSLDAIWEVKPYKRGMMDTLKEKAIPFSLILGLSVIIVAWTAFSTVLFGAMVFVLDPLIGPLAPLFLRSLQVILSLALGTLLFALIFKLLPETKVGWGDVWPAAALTAFIFTILNYLFGIYLSVFQVTTLAGTAGALMVLFLWIYVMNLFILFGAQFSKVYSEKTRGLVPRDIIQKKAEEIQRVEIKSGLKIKVREKTGAE
jgi:membrane protein